MVYIPKKYGQSKVATCLFCGKHSTLQNNQGVPVCSGHKDSLLGPMKCVCGQELDTLSGKWGLYFRCMDCGNMNLRKVLEFNEIKDVSVKKKTFSANKSTSSNGSSSSSYPSSKRNSKPTVIEIRSDDPRYFD